MLPGERPDRRSDRFTRTAENAESQQLVLDAASAFQHVSGSVQRFRNGPHGEHAGQWVKLGELLDGPPGRYHRADGAINLGADSATLKIEGSGPFTGTKDDVLALLSSRKATKVCP